MQQSNIYTISYFLLYSLNSYIKIKNYTRYYCSSISNLFAHFSSTCRKKVNEIVDD